MKIKQQFYPLFAFLFALMLMLAFTGRAHAEATVAECGQSISSSTTITVTDGASRTEFTATAPAEMRACGEVVDAHWSTPMCGDDEPWSGHLEVPTSCNILMISDTQVTQVTWIDESLMWDADGQMLVRATVTETLPSPTYEVWDEDNGRDTHIWTKGVTTTVWLDGVAYGDWIWHEERQKSQLIISQKPFGASFNAGSFKVVWEDYSAYWEVSESTVNRVLMSPTKIEIWCEDSCRDLILVNLDGASFPVNVDGQEFNDWKEFGDNQRVVMTLRGMPFAASFNLFQVPVLWQNYAQDWWKVENGAVMRIKQSPTRIQAFSENFGADIFMFNTDGKAFPVILDGVVYNDWRQAGNGKLKLSILGKNDAKTFSLGTTPVIWEDYSDDWDVDLGTNTMIRVEHVFPNHLFLPAVRR